MRVPAKIAPETIQTAARLYREGWRLRPLAKHLGCSFQRLSVHLRAAGVEMRGPSSPRASRLPTGERREAILAAVRGGVPLSRITAEYHTTRRAVRALADSAGVEIPALRRAR